MLCGTLLASMAVSRAAAAPPPAGAHYVALGDSFAAGSVDFPQSTLLACARSAVNYPSLVAQSLHVATFKDATCAEAEVGDLNTPQAGVVLGAAPPQFDVLTPDTTLVTLTMGGNDIGLAGVAQGCLNTLPWPNGISCAAKLTTGGHDVMIDRLAALAPGYSDALDEIHTRAPKATVLIVGYPTVSRPGGCPQQPAWPSDVDYLRGVLHRLNALLRTEAAKHHDTYVDTTASTIGHDMCATPDQQWINGLIPSFTTPSFLPLHPNTYGQQNLARQVLAALDAARPT